MIAKPTRESVRVLMVEDNPVDVDLLRLAFDQILDWNVEITVADDGEEALRLLQLRAKDPSATPHFVILDLNVPRRDGTEILQIIRSTGGLADLPVAILSSSPEDVIQRKLTAASVTADGHFTKPLGFEEFLELGHRLCRWYLEIANDKMHR